MLNIKNIKKEPLHIDWLARAENVDTECFKRALDYAVGIVSDNLENFTEKFPSAGGVNGVYQPTNNADTFLFSD